jgi:hypothetical protein
MIFDGQKVDTIADYAKTLGVKPATLTGWVVKARENDGVKPIVTAGNVSFFAEADMDMAKGKYGRDVKPKPVAHEQYQEVVDHRDRLAAENARLVERLHKLDALEAAGVDNWSGYDTAMSELSDNDSE